LTSLKATLAAQKANPATSEHALALTTAQIATAEATDARCELDIAVLTDRARVLRESDNVLAEASRLINDNRRADAELLVAEQSKQAKTNLELAEAEQQRELAASGLSTPAANESFEGKVLEVVVAPTASGFGFTLEGGHGLPKPPTFTKVVRYGASDVSGLKSFDVLLTVNDRDVRSGLHKEVIELLKRSEHPLRLTVFRPKPAFEGT
jgi:hypothetical protein